MATDVMKQNTAMQAEDKEPAQMSPDVPALAQQDAPALDHAEPFPAEWLGTNTSTLSAIERLKVAVDEETAKLEVREAVDFNGFSQRKNRGLLELTRAMRLTDGAVDPRVVPHLSGLRASLVKNQAALQIHLDAVREVSAIIARSIQEVESDGTYSIAGSSRSK